MKKPKHKRIILGIFKVLLVLGILAVIGYIVYMNFLVSEDIHYFYDIGSEEDLLNPYLSPAERVSDIIQEDDVDFRELQDGLVYFEIPIPENSEYLSILTKVKDNFPNETLINIGAKDREEWHYNYNNLLISESGEWIIGETQFDFDRDVLYIDNKKLSMVISIPHLSADQNLTNQNHIPIDWIDITITREGWLDRYNLRFWEKVDWGKLRFWE